MEPATSRFRTGDAAVMGAGATDYVVMDGMLEKTRTDIESQEAELKAARDARDAERIGAARERLAQLRTIETVQTTLQRVGIGLMAGGALGVAHGKYGRPQPRHEAATRERNLINQAISPAPPGGPQLARPVPPPPGNAFTPAAGQTQANPPPTQPPRARAPRNPNPRKRTKKPANDNDR